MKKVIFIAMLMLGCNSSDKNTESNNTKEVGGLILPDSLIAFDIVDEIQANGDGYLVYRYSIDEKNIAELRLQREFVALPFKKNEVIDNRIYDYMADGDEGYYLVSHIDKEDPRDQLIVLVNTTRMELIILMTFI